MEKIKYTNKTRNKVNKLVDKKKIGHPNFFFFSITPLKYICIIKTFENFDQRHFLFDNDRFHD